MSSLRAVRSSSFDVAEAVGGWRGIGESVLPTAVFIVVMAVRPTALVPALGGALAVAVVAAATRVWQRQPLTQALGGMGIAVLSAVWAWRSGEAKNFYATGLLINAAWLGVCLFSLLIRRPLIGELLRVWNATLGSGSETRDLEFGEASTQMPGVMAAADTAQEVVTDKSDGHSATQHREPEGAQYSRTTLCTAILAGMFALRLAVEYPLYLAGDAMVSVLGVARLALGLPLFAFTLWLMWLLLRPQMGEHRK